MSCISVSYIYPELENCYRCMCMYAYLRMYIYVCAHIYMHIPAISVSWKGLEAMTTWQAQAQPARRPWLEKWPIPAQGWEKSKRIREHIFVPDSKEAPKNNKNNGDISKRGRYFIPVIRLVIRER